MIERTLKVKRKSISFEENYRRSYTNDYFLDHDNICLMNFKTIHGVWKSNDKLAINPKTKKHSSVNNCLRISKDLTKCSNSSSTPPNEQLPNFIRSNASAVRSRRRNMNTTMHF